MFCHFLLCQRQTVRNGVVKLWRFGAAQYSASAADRLKNARASGRKKLDEFFHGSGPVSYALLSFHSLSLWRPPRSSLRRSRHLSRKRLKRLARKTARLRLSFAEADGTTSVNRRRRGRFCYGQAAVPRGGRNYILVAGVTEDSRYIALSYHISSGGYGAAFVRLTKWVSRA